MKRIIFSIAVYFLIIGVYGCTPITVTEEQKEQVLSSDPDFQKVLEAKYALDAQLAGFKAQFLSEKNVYESKVAALRREFEGKRAQFYARAQEVKGKLEPQRQQIKTELAMLMEEFKNKAKSQKAIKDMLNQAKAIAEGKYSNNLAEQDKAQWQQRFESLSGELSKVSHEIASIKEKLYILKLKQRSLIQ